MTIVTALVLAIVGLGLLAPRSDRRLAVVMALLVLAYISYAFVTG